MNEKIKSRFEQLREDIEIIDGAIELSRRLMNQYLSECNTEMALILGDTIDSLYNERELLSNELMSLMNA